MRRIEGLFRELDNNNSLPQEKKKAMRTWIYNIADKYVNFYKNHKVYIDVTGKEYVAKDNDRRDNAMVNDQLNELDEAFDNLKKLINTAY